MPKMKKKKKIVRILHIHHINNLCPKLLIVVWAWYTIYIFIEFKLLNSGP